MHTQRFSLSRTDSEDATHVVRIGPLTFKFEVVSEIDDLVLYELQVSTQSGNTFAMNVSAYYKTKPSDIALGALEDFEEMAQHPITDLDTISAHVRSDARDSGIELPSSIVSRVAKELQAKVKWAVKNQADIKEAVRQLG